MAKALEGSRTLRELDLGSAFLCAYIDAGYNSLGAEGAKPIAEALSRRNRTILRLNLDGNELSLEGASELANILSKNDSLLELSVCTFIMAGITPNR